MKFTTRVEPAISLGEQMSLGQELVAIALGYARARFTELRTAVLADADAFAQALGPGNDFDARNLVGSATQTWPGPVTLTPNTADRKWLFIPGMWKPRCRFLLHLSAGHYERCCLV